MRYNFTTSYSFHGFSTAYKETIATPLFIHSANTNNTITLKKNSTPINPNRNATMKLLAAAILALAALVTAQAKPDCPSHCGGAKGHPGCESC